MCDLGKGSIRKAELQPVARIQSDNRTGPCLHSCDSGVRLCKAVLFVSGAELGGMRSANWWSGRRAGREVKGEQGLMEPGQLTCSPKGQAVAKPSSDS